MSGRDAAVPEGFEWARDGRLLLCVRAGRAASLAESLRPHPEALLAGAPPPGEPPAGGRGSVARLHCPDGTRAVLRKYRRGGFAGMLLPDLLLGRARPLRELRVCEAARAAGLPVAEPLAAVFDAGGPVTAAYFLSVEVPAAASLAATLSVAPEAGRRAALETVARLLRRCHDAGLVHGDLNLRNILVAGAPSEGDATDGAAGGGEPAGRYVLVDLDGAVFRPEGARLRERFANLSRLARSHEKIFGRPGVWGGAPLPDLIGRYAAGDEALEAALTGRIARHERSLRWHRLGWRLSSAGRGN